MNPTKFNVPQLLQVLKRFPTQFFLATLSACCLAAAFLQKEGSHDHLSLIHLTMISICVFFSSLTIQFWLENARLLTRWIQGATIAGSILIAVIFTYLLLPYKDGEFVYRCLIFSIAMISLLSFSGSLRQKSVESYWLFTINMLRKALFAILCGGISAAGLILALWSVEILFGPLIANRYFVSIGFFTFIEISALVLLGNLNEESCFVALPNPFEKPLIFLVNWILIPLALLVFTIVYIYLISIAIKAEWPKGGLSHIFVGLTIIGGITYSLAHFWRKTKPACRWYVQVFFPLALVPLIVSIMALRIRILAYGWTNERYFLALSMLALLGMAIVSLKTKHEKLQAAALIVAILSLVSIFGPLSAHQISLTSQMNRFQRYLKNKPTVSNHDFERLNDMSSIVEYLQKRQSLELLASKSGLSIKDCPNPITSDCFMDSIGLKFVRPWENQLKTEFSFSLEDDQSINIAGFRSLYRFHIQLHSDDRIQWVDNGRSWSLQYSKETMFIHLNSEDEEISFDIKKFLESFPSLSSTMQFSDSSMMELNPSPNDDNAKMIIDRISGESSLELQIETISGYILLN